MNRIKELREAKKLTQTALARRIGVVPSSISQYESGARAMSQEIQLAMSDYFGVSIDYLLGREMETSFNPFVFPGVLPIKTKKVPLIGTIACGTPILASENIENYIDMDETVHADFCLRCKGDSMINARIFNGDIVYIRQQNDVENGEIAAVILDDETTLKRIYKYENRIELRADNPTFPPINIEGAQLETFRIIGKAVAFLSAVK